MGEYDQHVANWSVQEIRMRIAIVGQIIREAGEELDELRVERDKLTVLSSLDETQTEQLALIEERVDHLALQGIPEAVRQAEELNQIRIAKNKAIREEHGFEKPPDQVVGLRNVAMVGRAVGPGQKNGKLQLPHEQLIPIDPNQLQPVGHELSIAEISELHPELNHMFQFNLVCATCGFNHVLTGYPSVVVRCADVECASIGSYVRAAKIITTYKE